MFGVMKKLLLLATLLLNISLLGTSSFADIDLAEVEKLLTSDAGIKGYVHGASPESSLFVFTYRNPEDFFDHAEFPLITKDAAILDVLKTLKRHDQVVIKGKYAKISGAPQKHIEVASLEVTKPYENTEAAPPFVVSQEVKDEVTGAKEQTFRVHAVANGGKILVVDYKDFVLPVFVGKPEETKDLFRGDKIRFGYSVIKEEGAPFHLYLKKSVTVLEKINADHEKEKTLEGSLIYFPKSPQINFPVFALQPVDADGTSVQYTLVNFEDEVAFEKIREKLTALWKDHADTAMPARNRWINTNIQIRVTGIINVVSPDQANPQVLLSGPDAITVVE